MWAHPRDATLAAPKPVLHLFSATPISDTLSHLTEETYPMLLAYYGDDFTGSTDVLETLALNGLAADLCVSVPAAAARLTEGGLQALGIAGQSRTASPAEMDATLPEAFATLAEGRPRFLHYKVCSTCDSSPDIGSIGRAIEIGRQVLPARWTPVIVAAPHLGRWSAFGNLFARSGLDSPAYRLDRHPTMSRHPVTPMDEADIRLVLGRQTHLPVSLVNLATLDDGVDTAWSTIEKFPDGIVLFDATSETHLATIGRVLDRFAGEKDRPLFIAGSSGVERALLLAGTLGTRAAMPQAASPLPPGPVLILSGSRSPVTQRQLAAGVAAGFHELRIPPTADEPEIAAIAGSAITAHRTARSVIVRPGTNESTTLTGADLGRFLGRIAGRILEARTFRRVVIVGGDTSGEVARQLGISSLQYSAPLSPGAPWCHVRSGRPAIASCLFTFKGGQVGRDDLLVSASH